VPRVDETRTRAIVSIVNQPEPDYAAQLTERLRKELAAALRPGWFGNVQVTATVKNGRLFEFQVGALPSTRCNSNA
jgi:hypothetical protein